MVAGIILQSCCAVIPLNDGLMGCNIEQFTPKLVNLFSVKNVRLVWLHKQFPLIEQQWHWKFHLIIVPFSQQTATNKTDEIKLSHEPIDDMFQSNVARS